jgi:hypothetical protein
VVDLNADDFARESSLFQDLNRKKRPFWLSDPLKLNQWLTYLVNVVVDCPVVKVELSLLSTA